MKDIKSAQHPATWKKQLKQKDNLPKNPLENATFRAFPEYVTGSAIGASDHPARRLSAAKIGGSQ
nr:hypothetical protein [Marinicella sp. W31]MDC2879067.1 hypothetical protein [Marinicella sp. W31]